MLTEWKSDVVCFSETWLTSTSTSDSFLAVGGFSFFRRDRPHGHGGGLLIYANLDLQPRRRPDLEHPDMECVV